MWITHAKLKSDESTYKLRAATVLADRLAGVPDLPLPRLPMKDESTWQDIFYEEADGAG